MRARLLGAALLVLPLLLVAPGGGADVLAGSGVALEPVGGVTDWRRLLDAARVAAGSSTYVASMTIIQLDVEGPWVTEVPVVHEAGGRMEIGEPERWIVGRGASDEAFFLDPSTGTSLRLATETDRGFDVAALDEHYLVEVVGRATLVTGPALAVTFTRRDATSPSERVFVDEATTLVVRRETYDVDGDPSRVVALRDLVVTGEASMAATDAMDATAPSAGPRMMLSDEGIQLLDDAGWVAPDTLGDGFTLRSASAMGGEDGGDAVHLVYSDGLYRLSVYQQSGSLAPDAVAGASTFDRDGHRVWRWPGSEPERLVWSGGGRTFTAVSDAPTERLMQVIAPLPVDPPGGVAVRVRRGLGRLGEWLWPFDDRS